MPIHQDDYTIRLIDLPVRAGGFISESPDGHLNIYLNARHNLEKQRESFGHEFRHAENDDLNSDEDIVTMERRASGKAALASIPNLIRASDLLPKVVETVPQRVQRLLKLPFTPQIDPEPEPLPGDTRHTFGFNDRQPCDHPRAVPPPVEAKREPVARPSRPKPEVRPRVKLHLKPSPPPKKDPRDPGDITDGMFVEMIPIYEDGRFYWTYGTH